MWLRMKRVSPGMHTEEAFTQQDHPWGFWKQSTQKIYSQEHLSQSMHSSTVCSSQMCQTWKSSSKSKNVNSGLVPHFNSCIMHKNLASTMACNLREGNYVSPELCYLSREDRKREKRKQKIHEPLFAIRVLRFICQWICGGFKLTEFHPSSGTTQTSTNKRTIDPDVLRKYGPKSHCGISGNNMVGAIYFQWRQLSEVAFSRYNFVVFRMAIAM